MSLAIERARAVLETSIERAHELLPRTSESPDQHDALCFVMERAAWASIEIARHWVYECRLGMPSAANETAVFDLLRASNWIGLEDGRRLRQCAEYRRLSSRDMERVEWASFKAALGPDLEFMAKWLELSARFPIVEKS